MMNLNAENNRLSEAVLASGRLHDLLSELGCDAVGYRGGVELRGPCPVHLGDNNNFVVRADGWTFPIYWACYSNGCHKAPRLKNTLLGLVRGAPRRPSPSSTSFWPAAATAQCPVLGQPRDRPARQCR